MRSSPRPTRKLVPLLGLVALLAGGCRPGGGTGTAGRPQATPSASAQATLPGSWFQLAAGSFQQVTAPGAGAATALPWTVQERVSDLALLNGRLYLAVNGHGLACLEARSGGPPVFRYFYDPQLFRHRTLTALVPSGGSVLCHLYFNSLLNVVRPEDLPVRGLSLLRLNPQEGTFQRVASPFQVSHPGWECVGFAPLSDREFLMEWKLSGSEQTRFEYTRFTPASLSEVPSERQEYRRACEPEPFERLPAGLRPQAQELLRRLATPGPAPAVFFTVRSAADPLPRRYVYRPSGIDSQEGTVTAHAFQDAGRWLLLAPDGLLLLDTQGGSTTPRNLPPLPAGFQYTGLSLLDGLLVASWEQADFLTTGAAGIFISGGL